MKKNIFAGFRYYTEYKDTLKKEAQEKGAAAPKRGALCLEAIYNKRTFLVYSCETRCRCPAKMSVFIVQRFCQSPTSARA